MSRLSVETNATPSGDYAGYAVQQIACEDFWRWEAYGPRGTEAGTAPDHASAQVTARDAFRRLAQFGLDG